MGLILFVRAVVTILNVIKKLFKILKQKNNLCHICQYNAIDPPYCFHPYTMTSTALPHLQFVYISKLNWL